MTDNQTVFIVDDDEAIRDSLNLLITSVSLNVETFNTAQSFLEVYDPDRPGCLILDVRMPGMSGLELQQTLNSMHAILPVIIMTGHGDVPMAVQAMKEGAMEFIQKPFRNQDLLDCINRALELDASNRILLGEKHKIAARMELLTPREKQVMEMVIEGKANKVIAFDLGVSQRTVEIHRANVMDKMQAKSLAHLVRMVMQIKET